MSERPLVVRLMVPAAASAALLLAAPGTASADAIFDPVDAQELAALLKEATTAQSVCYGWDVDVNDQSSYLASDTDDSVGSDSGAGVPLDPSCANYVKLNVYITWTSESSESEDSASWSLESSSGGPTTADMKALELDLDDLEGDNPDVPIAKMVSALPLLAADKGMADLVKAEPAPAEPSADAQLTDSPGSDWWRTNGGMFLWGGAFLVAGAIFAWWVRRTNRGREQLFPKRRAKEEVPDTVPAHLTDQFPRSGDPRPSGDITPFPTDEAGRSAHEPPTQPFPATGRGAAEPPTTPFPAARSATGSEATAPESKSSTGPSSGGGAVAASGAVSEPESAVEHEPVVKPERPTDQKDKE